MKKYFLTIIGISTVLHLFSQNVGIGTSTPAVRLHIVNNADELVRLQGVNPYLSLFSNAGSPVGYIQAYGADLLLGTFIGNASGAIRFYNNNIERMTILPAGNVGIGIPTPASPLSFPNLLGKKISFWSNGPSNDFGIGIQSGVMQLYTAGQDRISFGWGSSNAFSETMRYATGSGQLMVGTSFAAGRLHLALNNENLRLTGSNTYLSFYNGNTYKGYLWSKEPNDIELGTATDNTNGNVFLKAHGIEALTVQSDGRVRAGVLPCVQALSGQLLPKLSVHGAFGLRATFDNQIPEWAIYPYVNLNFFYNGSEKAYINGSNGDWVSVSDARLKENHKPYKTVLDDIKKLSVLSYHYKANHANTESFGLVAQNVQEYFPEIVSAGGGPDNYLGIAYGKTGVIAIKAIQEQQEMIDAQKRKIETLEKRLALLESKIK